MLETDYHEQFARLIDRLAWHIALPPALSDFFDQRGYTSPNAFDQRRCPRARARHKAAMYFLEALPAFPRPTEPIGIYTTDLSRSGIGILCDRQLFPSEEVCILLPACWLEAKIVRGRRLGPRCFESGLLLKTVRTPDTHRFELPHQRLAAAAG